MTLYLKYRPQNLDDLDSKDVRESLKKIIQSKNIPHAFLFAGPKGIGKTSAARIIAKILNCERKKPPCGKCEQCLSITRGNNIDVIELDAASHRGIEDIRALREVVKLSPAKAKKKVYIIDEAHMLTPEASNALLKTLEEPPNHVVFILATTNPEKLIGTIRSRVTEIIFKKATNEEMESSLQRVVKGEKIKIDKDSLESIIKRANGSFRDGVKALEQFASEGIAFLKKSSAPDTEEFTELLFKKDLVALLSEIKKRVEIGYPVEDFIKEILSQLQAKLIDGEGDKVEVITLTELILDASRQIADSPIEELPLEIAVIKWCGGDKSELGDKVSEADKSGNGEKEEIGTKDFVTGPKINIDNSKINDEVWREILVNVRPVNATIEALLRAARPVDFDGKILTLGVFYKFHKERLEEGNYRKILEDVVAGVLGSPVRISCILTDPPLKNVESTNSSDTVLTEGKDQDIIKAAEEIFGV